MSGKKSFILYDDMAAPIETLSDKEAGILFKHIFAYRNNTNGLKPLEGGAAMAFQFIKQQITRDSEKWEDRAKRSRENGSKGGRPVKTPKPRKPSGLKNNPENPVGDPKPVNANANANVNGNVTVNANVKIKNPDYVEMVDLLISRIEGNNPKYFYGKNKEQKRDNWYEDIRLLKEKDRRTIEEIRRIINWCQSDSFWKSNILSASKLRNKFPQLELRSKIKSSETKPDYNEDAIIGVI